MADFAGEEEMHEESKVKMEALIRVLSEHNSYEKAKVILLDKIGSSLNNIETAINRLSDKLSDK